MTPLIREVLRRRLLGQSKKEIAEAIHKTPQWVRLVCKSPLFKMELERMEQKLAGRFVDIKREAMAVDAEVGTLSLIGGIAKSGDRDSTRLEACKTILNRAYGTPVQEVSVTLGFSIPDKFLEQATKAFGEVIDVSAEAPAVPSLPGDLPAGDSTLSLNERGES